MGRKLYKDTYKRDKLIYVDESGELQPPDGLVEIKTVYHVQLTEEDNFDYSIRGVRYRFSSEAGRQAYNNNPGITKVAITSPVTNPECLAAIGEGNRLVELYEEESKTPTKQKTKTES